MTTTAKLVIFRHGETEYNRLKLMTGQVDVPLLPEGEEQAKEAGKAISDIRFDKVFSSTLSRAFNTASLALTASGTQTHLLNADGSWKIEQRRDIIETDVGKFAGRCYKTDPEIVAFKRGYDIPLPGGESPRQVETRVRAFYEGEVLPRLKKGENVLVVAHAGILRMFEHVLGTDPISADDVQHKGKGGGVPNAAPIVFEYKDGALTGLTRLAANQNVPKDRLSL